MFVDLAFLTLGCLGQVGPGVAEGLLPPVNLFGGGVVVYTCPFEIVDDTVFGFSILLVEQLAHGDELGV